ncbi:hypothetical protein P8452_44226 [Trifolium repens]|nr:hypothetical protein P8452_44226 [Trifolium repens]
MSVKVRFYSLYCPIITIVIDRPSSLIHRVDTGTGKAIHCSVLTPSVIREMGLWTLLEGFLLLANALAILNEDRFLVPKGWGLSDFSGGRTKSFKGQIIVGFWVMSSKVLEFYIAGFQVYLESRLLQ